MGLYYTYSRHRSRENAEAALEEYYSTGEICDGEFPRIEKENGRWAVQVWDGWDGSIPPLKYRL